MPALLELRDAQGRCLITLLTNSVETLKSPVSSKLEFYDQDGRHVLAQVWQENDSIGQQLRPLNSAAKAAKRQSKHVQTAEMGKAQ